MGFFFLFVVGFLQHYCLHFRFNQKTLNLLFNTYESMYIHTYICMACTNVSKIYKYCKSYTNLHMYACSSMYYIYLYNRILYNTIQYIYIYLHIYVCMYIYFPAYIHIYHITYQKKLVVDIGSLWCCNKRAFYNIIVNITATHKYKHLHTFTHTLYTIDIYL